MTDQTDNTPAASSPHPSDPSTTSAKGWQMPAFSPEELQTLRTVPRNQLPADLRQKAEEHGLTDSPDHKPAL